MRRFSLYRRKKFLYVRFYDLSSKTYLSGRSTGATGRNEAYLVVSEWLKDGIPQPKKGRRPVEEFVSVGGIVESVRCTNLTAHDADRIVATA